MNIINDFPEFKEMLKEINTIIRNYVKKNNKDGMIEAKRLNNASTLILHLLSWFCFTYSENEKQAINILEEIFIASNKLILKLYENFKNEMDNSPRA